MEKQVVFNFGISQYSLCPFSHPWVERKMEIPTGGNLTHIPDHICQRYLNDEAAIQTLTECRIRNYSDVEQGTGIDHLAFQFEMLPEQYSVGKSRMLLIRIPDRNEFVAIIQHEWQETHGYFDVKETGPFELDEYCRQMLEHAFFQSQPHSQLQSELQPQSQPSAAL